MRAAMDGRAADEFKREAHVSSGTVKLLGLAALALVAVVAVTLLWQRPGPIAATGSGNSITSPDSADDVGAFASLALDANGNPVVSYYDSTNADLKILHCGDPSCSSGNTITSPDTVDGVGQFASLALDASGNPVVSYFDSTNGDLKLLHCGDPACSSGNTITAPDTAGVVGHFTSLALDGDGFPVVSYGLFSVKVLRCGNANCTSGNSIVTADVTCCAGVDKSLALDPSGNAVVTYTDVKDDNLKLLHCQNPTCSARIIAILDKPGDVGRGTSLALDASGNLVVSYLDATNGDLKVLRCNNGFCNGGVITITTPDAAGTLPVTGQVGPGTSLALDANSNPVVSYRSLTNGDLKILHCGDLTCSSGNTIATADTAGDVAFFSSLALDANGNPVVGYYDDSNRDLKLLHCADPNCKAPPPATPTPTATPVPPADTPAPPPPVGGIAVEPELGALALETREQTGDNFH